MSALSDLGLAAVVPSLDSLGPRFAAFMAGLTRPLVFFDLETTGVEPGFDRIVEICLVRIMPARGDQPATIEAPRVWRINPEMRIPKESTDVHGITNADVAQAPRFIEIADELVALLQDADLAGFAVARFDIRMLQNEVQRANKNLDLSKARIVDSQAIFHRREPRNLSAAVEFYCHRPLENAHGALVDTVASLEVFAGQLNRYEDLELRMDELHAVASNYTSNYVDGGRRFIWRDGEPMFNFGKLRGKSLRSAAGDPAQREYLRWIVVSTPDEDIKLMVREALAGKIRARSSAS